MKYLDQYKSYFSVLLNDVIPFHKKKNGEPFKMNNGQRGVLLTRKNDDDFIVMVEEEAFKSSKGVSETLPKLEFVQETYIQLKGITSEKDMVKKVQFAEIDLMDKKQIAIRYIDFETDTVIVPFIQPLYQTLTHYYPGTKEILDVEKIHVDDIHVDDIPIDYLITDNEIIILSIQDFQARRFEEVKKVLEFNTIDKFKEFIYSPEEKNPVLKKQIDFDSLNKYGVKYLYHITHISNLDNINKYGLLSHNNAHNRKLVNEDISDSIVNNRRNRKEPIYGKSLHDYVPFYFNPKNPMLYKRLLTMENEIVIMRINLNSIYNKKFLFTDGNAASKKSTIFSRLENLEKLDWACINAGYWDDYPDGKRKKCSEILIYDLVEVNYIDSICFNNHLTKGKISELFKETEIDLKIDSGLFF